MKLNYHVIGGGRLFALRRKHTTLLFLLVAARRSGSCSLIGGRRADLLHHVESDRVGSIQLSSKHSLASSIIASRLVLPIVVTIGQLCIDLAGRIEVLIYE
jgi:hypothetical protein